MGRLAKALVCVAALAVSLTVTIIRHEGMHAVGVLVIGGRVLGLNLLPGAGFLASVDVLPPPDASAGALCFVLVLPYLVDLVLMLAAVYLARSFASWPRLSAFVFRHALYFAMLDIVANLGASVIGQNDWALILANSQGMQIPVIIGLMIGLCAIVTWQTMRYRTGGKVGAGD